MSYKPVITYFLIQFRDKIEHVCKRQSWNWGIVSDQKSFHTTNVYRTAWNDVSPTVKYNNQIYVLIIICSYWVLANFNEQSVYHQSGYGIGTKQSGLPYRNEGNVSLRYMITQKLSHGLYYSNNIRVSISIKNNKTVNAMHCKSIGRPQDS